MVRRCAGGRDLVDTKSRRKCKWQEMARVCCGNGVEMMHERRATIPGPRVVLASLSTATTYPWWNNSLTTRGDAPKQAMGVGNIYISHMGVDQNKGIWDSYNRRSTANQSRYPGCQSREGSIVSDILCRESSKPCYVSQYLETWREPRPTRAGLTIARQSRTYREPIADFIDIFGKLNWYELILVVRLLTSSNSVLQILLCYRLSPLNRVSKQTRSYVAEL